MLKQCGRLIKQHVRRLRMLLVFFLVFHLGIGPGLVVAADRITGVMPAGGPAARALQSISPDALPELREIIEGAHLVEDTDANYMEVVQEQEQAIIEWESFDIGGDSHVHFNQTNEDGEAMLDWMVLNRIFDNDPSQIFGQLSADGKVFLINQNGFLFGSSGRISNLYSLTASALDIDDDDFRSGNYYFFQNDYNGHGADNYAATTTAAIDNQGVIEVANGGSVYLIAPEVINEGIVSAPNGHAALIAGEGVELHDETWEGSTRTQKVVTVTQNPGTAVNRGAVTSRGGIAGMYGGVVNQEGLITSVTAVYQNGGVELRASESITTGEGSTTGTPLDLSGDTVDNSFETEDSWVHLGGLSRQWDEESASAWETLADRPETIHHQGQIISPSGEVTLEAEEVVYLNDGSSIDVSGAWADRSASDNEIEMQLNSVELSDDFLARLGPLLGETITVNALVGTDVGHIDGHLGQGDKAVEEQNMTGGSVVLRTTGEDGRVVMEAGAEIAFAGGGIHYSAGDVTTSKVRIGDRIYDVGDIPDDVLEMADSITLLNDAEAARFGRTHIAAYDEGADAGSLTIETDQVVLNGSLDGSVTRGEYQTLAAEPTEIFGSGEDAISYQTADGLREPDAGELIIGDPGGGRHNHDHLITAVVFQQGPVATTEALQDSISYLSTDMLNAAGLGRLSVSANTYIDFGADAHLTLAPSQGSGYLSLQARRIDYRGSIDMPGGQVTLVNSVNVTTPDGEQGDGLEMEESIRLYGGSEINVAGEIWDNWNNPAGVPDQMHLAGGSVLLQARGTQITESTTLQDNSQGLYIDNGAVVDVSGGYAVDVAGGVSGGDAGNLELTGREVIIDGDLSGHSLLGNAGGSLTIRSEEIGIVHGGGSEGMTNTSLADGWIDQSGFSRLAFYSDGNLTVGDQVDLSPSSLKYTASIAGLTGQHFVTSPEYDIENTSITLTAGDDTFSVNELSDNRNTTLAVSNSADIQTGAGGALSLSGPQINLQGDLIAHGGDIGVEATFGALTMGSQALIDASGCAVRLAHPLAQGLPRAYDVYGGGTVSLTASGAELNESEIRMAAGALVDVSGSPQVVNHYRDVLGRERRYDLAASAGTVTLEAMAFAIDGDLLADNAAAGLAGGRLSIAGTDPASYLVLTQEDLSQYARSGFDAWAFSSVAGVQFGSDEAGGDIYIAATEDWSGLRELEIDAPVIQGGQGRNVYIDSVWTQLINSDDKYSGNKTDSVYAPEAAAVDGSANGMLELTAQWLDIAGSVTINGFDQVNLTADRDVTLADAFYIEDTSIETGQWLGQLSTYADLTLTAGRIYPTTDTVFTISTGEVGQDNVWQGGSLVIEQAEGPASDSPILSANGEVVLQTNQLTHNGTLLAPMGRIRLEGLGLGNAFTLGADSVLSTASDTAVPWGYYESDQWLRIDRTGDSLLDYLEVDALPQRSIDLYADNIVAEQGALIDVSGGGTVYAADFEPSIAGSANPLTASGRYVIMADQSVQLPGQAVYLEGIEGLAAGYYSLLPMEYAFLPGAIVIQDVGEAYSSSLIQSDTIAGYDQTEGYFAVMGSGQVLSDQHLFVVRDAGDILQEGSYIGASAVAGDGGDLAILCDQGSLQAVYSGAGLSSYDSGHAWIASNSMVLTSEDPEVSADEQGVLYLDPQSLTDAGFSRVIIGAVDGLEDFGGRIGPLVDTFAIANAVSSSSYTTQSLVVRNTQVDTAALGLFAEQLDIQSDVTIGSSDTVNEVVLAATQGGITLADDGTTTIEADALGIYADTMVADDQFDLGDVVAVVSGGAIDLSAAMDTTVEDHVVRLGYRFWNQWADADQVALAGANGIHISGAVNVSAGDLFYFDSPLWTAAANDGASFSATDIYLANSAEALASDTVSGGNLNFNALGTQGADGDDAAAGQIVVHGSTTMAGFDQVTLSAVQDLVFSGEGSLDVGGDLILSAGRVTAGTFVDNGNDIYQNADFTVTADGLLSIEMPEGAQAGEGQTPGGILSFAADTIDHQGMIDNFSGVVSLTADTAILLDEDSRISAGGGIISYSIVDETVFQAYGSGAVILDTAGDFDMQPGAVIDVSNSAALCPEDVDADTWAQWVDAGDLDAGAISIYSPAGDSASIAGSLLGQAAAGYTDEQGREVAAFGGSVDITTSTLDFSTVNSMLTDGGFDRQVRLRAGNGDIDVFIDDVLAAQQIQLTADTGAVNVYGTLDARGRTDDHYIRLYARDNVDLYATSELNASGLTGWDAAGGDVQLSSSQGFVRMHTDEASGEAAIDVGGSGGTGGGNVRLRAGRYVSGQDDSMDYDVAADDVRIRLDGTISGAETVSVEAVRVYDEVLADDGDYLAYDANGNIQSGHITNLMQQTGDYLAAAGGVVDRLLAESGLEDGTHLLVGAGVEIVRAGDLTLGSAWDLSSAEAGFLSLRTSEDLTIAADLWSQPHSPGQLLSDTDTSDSWTYTLVAGADLGSADSLAVNTDGHGDMIIDDYHLVYTESGDIGFAAGGNVQIGLGQTRFYDTYDTYGNLPTSYTLATHDGSIMGFAGGNMTITGAKTSNNAGAIQSATGDIQFDIAGSLTLGDNAAIRTTGVTTAKVTEDQVSQDGSLSWLLEYAVDLIDPESGETITVNGYEAIVTYADLLLADENVGQRWIFDSYAGSIYALAIDQFQSYDNGGNIRLSIGQDLVGNISNAAFFQSYHVGGDMPPDADMAGAPYIYQSIGSSTYRPAAGIITMAGGDIDITAGGRVGSPLTSQAASQGVQIAAFDEGDITLRTGGDVDGRFLIADGRLSVTTLGSFGSASPDRDIEIVDSAAGPPVTIDITAQNDISVGAVIDPLMATYMTDHIAGSSEAATTYWAYHFTDQTALSLAALAGDIRFTKYESDISEFYNPHFMVATSLPANVSLTAGNDIAFANEQALWLMPASDGGLQALAGGDIYGTESVMDSRDESAFAQVIVSNLAPEQLYYDLALPGVSSWLSAADLSSTFRVSQDYNGFTSFFKQAFETWWDNRDMEWWQGLDDEARAYYVNLAEYAGGGNYLLHEGDSDPITLTAGGDIFSLSLNSPKLVEILANGDISDIYFKIQHTNKLDQSVVAAGGHIECSLQPSYYYYSSVNNDAQTQLWFRQSGVELSGGGDLVVAAGEAIDLGQSSGLRTQGNVWNSALDTQGADLTVLSGYDVDAILQNDEGLWDAGVAEQFFDDLQDGGIAYSALKYGEIIVGEDRQVTDIDQVREFGEVYADLLALYDAYEDVPQEVREQLADLYLTQLRETLITPHLATTGLWRSTNSAARQAVSAAVVDRSVAGIDFVVPAEPGDIRMTRSQIYTQRSGDINMIAANDIDVGISAFGSRKSDTGINTMLGGDINVYTGQDLNVNESRIMTWYGGDITLFADYGNINAGKGSKTTVGVSEPEKIYDQTTDSYTLEYTLPAVGSGIRLLTYDPDGAAGPKSAAVPGNAYLFAPEGEIDAGEAGIVGQGNILLSALVVTNAQNIAVSGLSSGASIAQDAGGDMGGLSGGGGLAGGMAQHSEDVALTSAKERFSEYVANISESLVPRWIAVEVIDFVQNSETDSPEENETDEDEGIQ